MLELESYKHDKMRSEEDNTYLRSILNLLDRGRQQAVGGGSRGQGGAGGDDEGLDAWVVELECEAWERARTTVSKELPTVSLVLAY
jgi:hypothetical protein